MEEARSLAQKLVKCVAEGKLSLNWRLTRSYTGRLTMRSYLFSGFEDFSYELSRFVDEELAAFQSWTFQPALHAASWNAVKINELWDLTLFW